jgi:hypothetical protein
MKPYTMTLEAVVVPDGRTLRVEVDYIHGTAGSYYQPPDPPEVNVKRAWDAAGRELAGAEVDALVESDEGYEAVLSAAEAVVDKELAEAEFFEVEPPEEDA